eukprot:COSAG06_NODE_1106_length_10684_cov_5.383656_13_plen_162_part_00
MDKSVKTQRPRNMTYAALQTFAQLHHSYCAMTPLPAGAVFVLARQVKSSSSRVGEMPSVSMWSDRYQLHWRSSISLRLPWKLLLLLPRSPMPLAVFRLVRFACLPPALNLLDMRRTLVVVRLVGACHSLLKVRVVLRACSCGIRPVLGLDPPFRLWHEVPT